MEAHGLVGFRSDEREAVLSRDRHGCDDAGRALRSCPAEGGDHRSAGGEAVVDDDDRLAAEVERTVLGVQARVERGRLRSRMLDGGCELLVGQAVVRADVDAVLSGCDRSEAVFGLAGVSDLADRDDVERRFESAGYRGGDFDAASRKPDDDRRRAAFVFELARERDAGIAAVAEERLREDAHAVRLAAWISALTRTGVERLAVTRQPSAASSAIVRAESSWGRSVAMLTSSSITVKPKLPSTRRVASPAATTSRLCSGTP